MPKVFITCVSEFRPDSYPILGFYQPGRRKKFLDAYKDGDLVFFLGTKSGFTKPQDKGYILGAATFYNGEVSPVDFLSKKDLNDPNHLNDGEFKWPYAVKMKKAWVFRKVPKPKITDYIKQKIHYIKAGVEAVPIEDKIDEQALLSLLSNKGRKVEIIFPGGISTLNQIDIEEVLLESQGHQSGPAPSEYTTTIKRTFDGAGFTYALRFGDTDIWKIGRTKNLKNRLKAINNHIPHEILEQKWEIFCSQEWKDEIMAHKMEQELLCKILKDKRTFFERVQCTEEELNNAWDLVKAKFSIT